MSLFKRVKDYHAFAGALALLLVGTYLSVMMGFYFFPGGEAFALLQSRWWWELSLSLQILCFALMWICHHDRVFETSGWKKARAFSRMIVGMAGVSVPIWVLVICAVNDWFQSPPDLMDLAYYACVVFAVWVVMAYVLPLMVAFFTGKSRFIYVGIKGMKAGGAWFVASPFLLILLVAAIEIPRDSHMHIVIWPFLTYLHGALPYLKKAYVTADTYHSTSIVKSH